MTHFHVAGGLAGYGPDGSDGYHTGETPQDVADLIRDELRYYIDMLAIEAETAGERQEYERYYKANRLAEKLETMRANLDPARADAPLYAGDLPKWHATLRNIFLESFPLTVSLGGNSLLYAWQCDQPDDVCEHNADAMD